MNVVIHPGRLRQEMARRGWNASDLAREASLSPPTVSAALAGRAIAPKSLFRIAEALVRAPTIDVVDVLLMSDRGPGSSGSSDGGRSS